MTARWNDLPPECRLLIIDNLDFISRVKLSACAKTEQQLVRNNPFKLDEIWIQKPRIYLMQEGIIRIEMTDDSSTSVCMNHEKENILENEHPKEAVKKIFKSLGTRCIVENFKFFVESGFIDMIEWFRENFNISPNTVNVIVRDDACQDIEPFINWPKNVKISLNCNNYHGPLFERLDTYDNIVEFSYRVYGYDIKNTKLMKLPNSTRTAIFNCDIDGFLWWVKQWLLRDDYSELDFSSLFDPPLFDPLKVDEMKNGLGDFLIDAREERTEDMFGQEVCWHFLVRNKLNGRVGRIRLDKESINFDDNGEVQQCLNSLETIKISP